MWKTNLFLCGLLFSVHTTVRAQGVRPCEDCPAFDARGKVEVRQLTNRLIGDPSEPVRVRVDRLVAQMTLEEKIAQLVSESDSISRLNLPAYNYWNECLHGVARAGEVTVFPQAINLASTWDTLLVKRVASAISTEARIKYLEIGKGLTYWSPTINMARDPRWGRNEETYGEDPYLTSRIGVAFVKGLQGDHPDYLKTVATVKHFVANNQENDRFNSSSQIPTKQLYEYYFPAYEACVREANVQSVMTAYNAINGAPSSGSSWLIDEVLRKQWGFGGFVVSDCGAIGVMNWQHRTVNSLEETVALGIKAGCDLECGTTYGEKLLAAVRQGLLTEQDIDRSVKRVLTARFKLGEFDPLERVPYNHYDKRLLTGEQFRELAYDAAVKSIVLLKNKDAFLPIDKSKVKSVAVIGPFADHNYLGGYSGQPARNLSLLQGVKELLGEGVEVTYLKGTDVISPIAPEYLLAADKHPGGLTAEYFDTMDLGGKPLFTRTDSCVGFDWGDYSPDKRLPNDRFAVRWQGYLRFPVAGAQTLGVYVDGGIRIWMNDRLVLDRWDARGLQYFTFEGTFAKGKPAPLKIEYINRTGMATCFLLSTSGNLAQMKKVREVAAKADLVLAALGNDELLARENRDLPTIYLPLSQENLLKEIYAVNPRVALILHTGNPLTSVWAADHVPAILQAWYPGQEAGRALADILFGMENPSAKLPMSIYKNESQLPDILDYDIWKGRTYRYMTGEPLYGFGFGLSYTTFRFSDMQVNPVLPSGASLTCSVNLTNTGQRAGEEVVQVYVSREHTPVYTFPLRKLVAFQKVRLEPGETKTVNISVDPRQLSVWDEGTWRMLTGKYTLYIGNAQPGQAEGISGMFEIMPAKE